MAINFRKLVAPSTAASDPYAEASRQRALADALAERSAKPRDFGTMSTGQATTLGLAQLAEALLARRAGNRATGAENAARTGTIRSTEAMANQIMPPTQVGGIEESQIPLESIPGMSIGNVEDPGASGFELQSRYQSPTTGQELTGGAKSLTDALAGIDPRQANALLLQKRLEQMMPDPAAEADRALKQAQFQATLDEKEQTRLQRIDEIKMRLAQEERNEKRDAEAAKRADELRKELAVLTNNTRRDIAQMGADQKKADAAAAAAAKQAPVDQGRNILRDQIAELRDLYTKLQESGGITDTTKGSLENAGAYARSSALGQFAGKVFGTKDQSRRNSILQQRPLLIQSIKQATGMSAQQLNSNVELQLFLNAATNPEIDVQANLRALDGLEQFATGGTLPPSTTITAPAGAGGSPRAFATEAEAEASGVKGEVTIGGRKAFIE